MIEVWKLEAEWMDGLMETSRENSATPEVCGAEFDSFDSLNEHVRSQTEDKKHKNHQGFDAY